MNKAGSEIVNSVNWDDEKLGEWGSRVPHLLNQLLEQSENAAIERTDANFTEGLCSIISHQGTLTQLSATTLPILLALLENKQIQRKHWLLYTIGSLVFSGEIVDDIQKQIYLLMREKITLFGNYLKHEHSEYRKAAGEILSRYTLHINPVAMWICDQALVESNDDVLTELFRDLRILLMTLRNMIEVDEFTSEYLQTKLHPFLRSSNRNKQIGAATIFLILQREHIESDVKHIVMDCIRDREVLVKQNVKIASDMRIALSYSLKAFRLDMKIKEIMPELPLETIQKYIMPLTR